MSSAADDNPFWRFSIRLYAKAGVAPQCLALQDEHGVDVNLMLFCLYAGSLGHALSPAQLDTLEACIGAWREHVVVPLRGARRWLKAPPAPFDDAPTAALRDRLKQIELESERLQQAAMVRAVPLAESSVDGSAAHGMDADGDARTGSRDEPPRSLA
ncbi:MAG: TIGR02444 family protein, partial [Burkholderiaceae bacterium]